MPNMKANGIEIEYDTFGSREGRPLVLIMGLTSQMIEWPEAFCRMLADLGHFVVRFDNRDVGLSTKMAHLGVPDVNQAFADYAAGQPVKAPYQLKDMAEDTIGLMNGLGLDCAHVCGLSMGGMIAQVAAMHYPERLASMIALSSTTSEPGLPGATPEASAALVTPPPSKRQPYIDHLAWVYRAFSGGSEKYDEVFQREMAAQAYDRSFYPMGFARQMTAILASGRRKTALNALTVPTLVIQGSADPLTSVAHGRDIAEAVPDARLHIVDGLGHGSAYPALWPEVASAIAAHTAAHGGD